MSTQAAERPPLAALVYRIGKGCQQYPFATADELQQWAARHPYRNEVLHVLPVKADGTMGNAKVVPAGESAEFVRIAGGVQ